MFLRLTKKLHIITSQLTFALNNVFACKMSLNFFVLIFSRNFNHEKFFKLKVTTIKFVTKTFATINLHKKPASSV